MSKANLIESVARSGAMSKAQAKRTIELVFGEIEAGIKALKSGGKLPIGAFGVFSVTKRGPRNGHNPRTGEAIRIKAGRTIRFKPGGHLKKAVRA